MGSTRDALRRHLPSKPDRVTVRQGGGTRAPAIATHSTETFGHRHRLGIVIVSVIVVLLAGGAGGFVYLWNHTGPHQLSMSTAIQRFRSGATGMVIDPGTLHPPQGVYEYTGSGSEHVSLPPKSQTEGPGIPGTVSYLAHGCWSLRLDYSDSHWQSATFCPRNGDLVEVGRGGWYRWDFVAFVIADTATFTCPEQEVVMPVTLRVGERFAFRCSGTNSSLNTGVVTMSGTNQYVGAETLRVGHTSVPTLHFHEVARFGGGQSGTNVADTWFSTVNGLPIRGTWSTRVTTPTALGSSTLTGRASFSLLSLTPRS